MRPLHLRVGSLDLVGFSRSGLASYVLAPALDACFDLGHCDKPAAGLRHVLLSHVHQDHSLGLVRHMSLRAMSSAPTSRVYVPAEDHEALVDMLRAYERLERRPPARLDVIPVAPGDTFRLPGGYSVRAFDVTHRVPSRGYTVTQVRRKLKQTYHGLPSEEVARLARQGIPVTDDVTFDLVTYVGDSTIETLDRHPEVGQSEVLLLEATYLPPDPHDAGARYGHTHLAELVDLYHRRPEALAARHVVLKHFSMKYSDAEVREALATLPEELRARVTPLLA